MSNPDLAKLALRYRAIYLDIDREEIDYTNTPSPSVIAFVSRLNENGYTVSEELLHALNNVSANTLADITLAINDRMGTYLNWAPLVKGWDTPTGESQADHLATFIANIYGFKSLFKGETLPCGHIIPEGSFNIERYNGCPFCGTQFKTANRIYKGQGSKLKELRLFTKSDISQLFISLLTSPTPLDATQKDTLTTLLTSSTVPDGIDIAMRETAILAIKTLVENGKGLEAGKFIKTPTDVLRYLWFEKTGQVQIIKPKTLISQARRTHYHMSWRHDRGDEAAESMKIKLRLKYDRKTCRMVASWLNGIHMTPKQAAENMNPARGMWVRMIRALRLGEYSRRKGFEHLSRILDVFYNEEYETWQGKVDAARINNDADTVINMLKERPGTFARSLFATMLRFGAAKTLSAFEEIADSLPSRLLLSLENAAEFYFDYSYERIVRPITGKARCITHNMLLLLYNEEELQEMPKAINRLFQSSMARRFALSKTTNKTIYIDNSLFDIPVSVGDRSNTVQDTSCALPGTRFPVEGDSLRLFMQWGKGLPAQHLDMDLSCRIALPDYNTEDCAYYSLQATGAKHSGDIRSIPHETGTAEYIELSIPELEDAGATHVTFACNAYSCGALSPNLVVGWMSSAHPMKISEENGVAYDPSCVQHMVRISESNLSKGLFFGVLDVAKREIIWFEMPLGSQTIQGYDSTSIQTLIKRLEAKLSIGDLLRIKARSQGLTIVESVDEADEVYTYEWALNPAGMNQLLSL